MAITEPSPRVDATQFRYVIGHFMSGVTVVTTRHDGRDHGMTASAVSSLSLDPPMLTVCLHRESPTQEAIVAGGAFAVNILREGQDELAARFARPQRDKFAGVAVRYGRLGQPLLADALATLECRVTETVVGGTHRVFLAAVVGAEVGPGAPLAYYRGRFGRLEIAEDDLAVHELRRAILRRAVPLDERLDPERLAALTGAPVSAIEFALVRLLSERLVTRDADGYRQVPLDVARCEEAFEAKLVIDLGAARLGVARASEAELSRLMELAEATEPSHHGVTPEQVPALVEANEAFHEAAIALGGNQALLDAYRRLGLTAILSPVLWRDHRAAEALADEHRHIAGALHARDLGVAEQLITAHNHHARSSHAEAIVAAGGRM